MRGSSGRARDRARSLGAARSPYFFPGGSAFPPATLPSDAHIRADRSGPQPDRRRRPRLAVRPLGRLHPPLRVHLLLQAREPAADRLLQGAGRAQPAPHAHRRRARGGRDRSQRRKPRPGRRLPRRAARDRRQDRHARGHAAHQGGRDPRLRSRRGARRRELRRGLRSRGRAGQGRRHDLPAPVRRLRGHGPVRGRSASSCWSRTRSSTRSWSRSAVAG